MRTRPGDRRARPQRPSSQKLTSSRIRHWVVVRKMGGQPPEEPATAEFGEARQTSSTISPSMGAWLRSTRCAVRRDSSRVTTSSKDRAYNTTQGAELWDQ